MTGHKVDLLVVGAGPVGLYGAYYAGVRGLSTAIIDSLSEVGGQVSALYPEKMIFDIAGYPAVKGRDLVEALLTQASAHRPQFLLGQEAQNLRTDSAGRFQVETSSGDSIDCGAVVVTGGIGTFTPRQLPAGEIYLGRGLDYFVPDPARIRALTWWSWVVAIRLSIGPDASARGDQRHSRSPPQSLPRSLGHIRGSRKI